MEQVSGCLLFTEFKGLSVRCNGESQMHKRLKRTLFSWDVWQYIFSVNNFFKLQLERCYKWNLDTYTSVVAQVWCAILWRRGQKMMSSVHDAVIKMRFLLLLLLSLPVLLLQSETERGLECLVCWFGASCNSRRIIGYLLAQTVGRRVGDNETERF